jgi:hypothetical protein
MAFGYPGSGFARKKHYSPAHHKPRVVSEDGAERCKIAVQ